MREIVKDIEKLCLKHQNSDYAIKMKSYMKGHFEFYGINGPIRKNLVKEIKAKHVVKSPDTVVALTKILWNEPYREMQYIGLDILLSMAKKFNPSHLPTLEYLIVNKSWWDTVDMIVPNLVGSIWQHFPESRDGYLERWMASNNFWLHRSSIIFQLRYKQNVDRNILATAILTHENSKEFFVRKAQGWALRELSKFDPKWVKDFLTANPQLSGLTHREASKYI